MLEDAHYGRDARAALDASTRDVKLPLRVFLFFAGGDKLRSLASETQEEHRIPICNF